MHNAAGAYDLAAIGFNDGLVSQADAEDGDGAAPAPDEWDRDAGFSWCAGAGGDHDGFRCERIDILDGDGVVSFDAHVLSKLAQVLNDIEGEGIVVVEN